ncbi:MAG: hypothetical protein ACO3UU_04115 [Minisyncoccia bacterium]
MKLRIGSFEYRHGESESDRNRDPEIVKFLENGTCYTIAFWRLNKEGYYVESVGSRLIACLPEKEFIALLNYGQSVLDAHFTLKEFLK